uniref:Secreted protein n=1 Tax=Macrostomum lignano TaxID=282301 RepID=A0A1I8FCH5_9PLAT
MPAAAPRPHWPPWCSSAARPGRWNFAVASVRVAGSSGGCTWRRRGTVACWWRRRLGRQRLGRPAACLRC